MCVCACVCHVLLPTHSSKVLLKRSPIASESPSVETHLSADATVHNHSFLTMPQRMIRLCIVFTSHILATSPPRHATKSYVTKHIYENLWLSHRSPVLLHIACAEIITSHRVLHCSGLILSDNYTHVIHKWAW